MTGLIKIHPVACLLLFFLFLFVAHWRANAAPRPYHSSRNEIEYYVADNAAVAASLVMAAEFLGLAFYNCRLPTRKG